VTFQSGKSAQIARSRVQGYSPAIRWLTLAMLGRAHLRSGAGVGRGGLVLLIDRCCFVWSALYLALTLLILLFLARDLALTLLK
jgi:hypothetical protein